MLQNKALLCYSFEGEVYVSLVWCPNNIAIIDFSQIFSPFMILKRNYCFILEFHWEENFLYSCSVLLEVHVNTLLCYYPCTTYNYYSITQDYLQSECLQGKTLATWKWTAMFLFVIGTQALLLLCFPQRCGIDIKKPSFVKWFIKMEHEIIKTSNNFKPLYLLIYC